MPGPPVAKLGNSTSLAITNPLVLYRTLVATKRIKPDPAQHRLALQLQKLYFRLKDYRPEIEYRRRLDRVTRGVARTSTPNSHPTTDNGAKQGPHPPPPSPPSRGSGIFSSLLTSKATAEMRALTRSTPLHDSALTIDSPQGLLLYGGVGRGKSMLLDLLFASLPTAGKRRWHFSTFMLDVFRRLEVERVARAAQAGGMEGVGLAHEHVVLALARETVETSPVLFLDEFQMPDRASSRLVNGFLTGFFGLGGVLVASSNRMPEELSKGQGVRFADPYWGGRQQGKWGRGGWVGWFGGQRDGRRPPDETERFVEALKARCEIWEMEGLRDWRREEIEEDADMAVPDVEAASIEDAVDSTVSLSVPPEPSAPAAPASSDVPPHYHLSSPALSPSDSHLPTDIAHLNPSGTWEPLSMTIYGRTLSLPSTHPSGVLLSSFTDLCTRHLGPADYVSICARFHSIILTDIPVLTNTMKNEARRLIWLIDAMYEAGVRLVVSAEAPVDKLFFPERASRRVGTTTTADDEGQWRLAPDSDSIESEAMSEMYQDSTAPFRPNVASYGDGGGGEWRSASPTFAPGRGDVRNVLADEDADFGPTYGNGRGHGMGASEEQLGEVLRRQGMGEQVGQQGGDGGSGELSVGVAPDFTDTRVLVGEDEKFAYRRARSRLWEMCGRRWWRAREGEPSEWWRPEGGQGRFWEGISAEDVEKVVREKFVDGSHDGGRRRVDALRDAEGEEGSRLFRHGASPYRTNEEAPPKFGWQHAWGMMKWGRKAGEWGKGVEGDRRKDVRSTDEKE